MMLNFDSTEERDKAHDLVRSAAEPLNENNEVLRTLFELENGGDPLSNKGFGHVRKNAPDSRTVTIPYGESEFEKKLELLSGVDEEDLGSHDGSAESIIKDLENLVDLLERAR